MNVADGPRLPARFPQEPQPILKRGDALAVDHAGGPVVVVEQSAGKHVEQIDADVERNLHQALPPLPDALRCRVQRGDTR